MSTDTASHLMEEYKLLREEQMYFMNKDTTLSICLFSEVSAALFLSVQHKVPEGCLLAFLIILPICVKLAYHQKQSAKIAAYLSEYLEKRLEIQWETSVQRLSKVKIRERTGRFLKFSECPVMASAALATYTCLSVEHRLWEGRQFLFVVETILAFVLFIAVLAYSRNIYRMKEYREKYTEAWRLAKNVQDND